MEQLPHIHAYGRGNVLKPRDSRRINPALNQSDEINRILGLFCELFLRQVRLTAKMRNVFAKQSIKVGHCASVEELARG
jgi:hypothetical protein